MLKKIIDVCTKQGYIQKLVTNTTNNDCEILKLGPAGALLQENLRNEWFYSMVTNRDINIFINTSSFSDAFNYAKEICHERLPFGIAEIINSESINKDVVANNDEAKLVLKSATFVAPANSTSSFHQLQRQRRMWWRKLSADPGRYSLTDIKSDENGTQSLEICAKYSWGLQMVESLTLSPAPDFNQLTAEQLQTKDGRKKVYAHSITSVIHLSNMVLNTLCDAYDESLFQGQTRSLLRLHRKLAPYKISFAISSSQSSMTKELSQLALYLCKQLRSNNISSLLIPGSSRNTLEMQWRQYDQMGIPYTLLLNENTLKNGIASLRSRDTTLKEQIHVTDLPNYVEQLFKNY